MKYLPSTSAPVAHPSCPRKRRRGPGETGDLLVPRQIWQGRQVLLHTLLLVGKWATGGLQGLGTSPQQLQPPASSCSGSPTVPAPAPRPPPPPLALAPFHPRNPPRAEDKAPARLLWLTDELLLTPMLVDTGASTSVYPSWTSKGCWGCVISTAVSFPA